MTERVKQLTGSRKRDFRLNAWNEVAPRAGWCEGSSESHKIIAYVPGAKMAPLICGDHFSKQTVKQELSPGCIMVTTGTFAGKPGWPVITCRVDEEQAVREWLGLPANIAETLNAGGAK